MKLIYDCDAGADDALALLLLCRSKLPLAGVCTCFGGFPPEKATEMAENILKAEKISVPVCTGAGSSLCRGGPVHSSEAFSRRGHGMRADEFLQNVSRSDAPWILLATGPLTNVARMLRTCSRLPKRIIIMGGGISGGNRTPFAEFNFFCDPEAADAVLQSGCPITLVPLEAARACTVTQAMLPGFSPAARQLLAAQMAFARRTGCGDGTAAIACDAVAAAGLIDARVFAEVRPCTCRVDCSQTDRAGALCISDEAGPVTLVERADPDAFRRVLTALKQI